MKISFNRIVALKNKDEQMTVSKLVDFGFKHSFSIFENGKPIDVIRLSKNDNIKLCLIDNVNCLDNIKIWNQKPIADFEIIYHEQRDFSRHVSFLDFIHNDVHNHPPLINGEYNHLQKDEIDNSTAIMYKQGIIADSYLPEESNEQQSIIDIADYDVAVKLQVRDLKKSFLFYASMGFVPECVQDNLDYSSNVILKHNEITGLKMILCEDEKFTEKLKRKTPPKVDKTVTFVLMPKTSEDFEKMEEYYRGKGIIAEDEEFEEYPEFEDEEYFENDLIKFQYLGYAGKISIEMLYFKTA